MNICVFFGRLGSEPKKQVIIKGDKEVPLCSFKLAVEREYWGGKNNKDFLPMVAYGRMADLIYNNFKLGSKIVVHCQAQADSTHYYTVQFNVSRIYFCEPKEDIERSDEEIGEIYIPPNFNKLEEVEETLPTNSNEEKPKKRSKKSQG